jgi:membrane protease YdiL (CAAX protease family)
MKGLRADQLFAIAGSLAVYISAGMIIGKPFEFVFIVVLLVAALAYALVQKHTPTLNEPRKTTALLLLIYAGVYFAAIYPFNVLGMSVVYPVTHVLLPLVIIWAKAEKTDFIPFQWRAIFTGFGAVALAALITLPYLVFTIRDSAQILALLKSPKGWLYVPISVVYMIILVASWEEFLFRGVILSSLLRVTRSPALSIFVSSMAFAAYHIPMKYYNEKSPSYHEWPASIAGTFYEQFIMGLFLGFCVYRSKNLWHGIWLHGLFNGISFAYKMSLLIH